MTESRYSIDVIQDDFQTKVLEQSKHLPVLVDFWAPWCAPCKNLMPLLEKIAEDYQGQFLLAKVNTEEQQDLATQFSIRSIPQVKLFIQGEVIDEFSGVLTESEIKQFLEKHLFTQADGDIGQDIHDCLAQDKTEEALVLLETALQQTPNNIDWVLSYAHLQISQGNSDKAEQVANNLDEEQQKLPEIKAIHVRIKFEALCKNALSLDELLQLDQPESEQLYHLAARYVANNQADMALEILFRLFKKDQNFLSGAAKTAMFDVFNILGNTGDLVNHYRKQIFNWLH